MVLQDLLNQVREFYLDHFREVVKEKRRVPRTTLIAEPALRQPGGQVARQGSLKLPVRTDLVVNSTGAKDTMQVATENSLGFDPVTVDWATLKLELAPFHWEQCQAHVHGLPSQVDWHPVIDWYERWFDEFDRKVALKKSFQEVVHGLGDPVSHNGETTLTVDFGSAPITAFEEFLDALAQMGATSGIIGEPQKNGQQQAQGQPQP
jgi:hypothetical protein